MSRMRTVRMHSPHWLGKNEDIVTVHQLIDMVLSYPHLCRLYLLLQVHLTQPGK